MIPEAVMVAIVGAVGLVLSGVLVELIRARRRQDAVAEVAEKTETVVQAVTPNHGSSLADGINRVERDIGQIREDVQGHGERLARVEAVLGAQMGLSTHPGLRRRR